MITSVRNFLYDKKIFKSTQFDIPVIGVGNLSVGGTGKTPMVEYLINFLSTKYTIATLSRGYGRRTRGFRIAVDEDNAATIGDEPYQLFKKFKDRIFVSVGEERVLAIPQLLYNHPEIQAIILDDAYQHRTVRPVLQILLTEYSKPFYKDQLMPAGRLRESVIGARRADIVIVTKCPAQLNEKIKKQLTAEIHKYSPHSHVFFSTLQYDDPVPLNVKNAPVLNNVVLVSGIANARPLVDEVRRRYNVVKHFDFADHYSYTEKDIEKILNFIKKEYPAAGIITTEKDAVKLVSLLPEHSPQVYALPVRMSLLSGEDIFRELLLQAATYKED